MLRLPTALMSASICLSAWLVSLCPLVSFAAPRPEQLVDLFMPAEFSGPELSPDGARLAFWARRGDTYAIGILSFATRHTDYYAGDGKVHPINFWWKDARRLLMETSKSGENTISFLAYDVENQRTSDLDRLRHVAWGFMDPLPGDPGHVLMGTREEVARVSLETFHGEKISGVMPGTEGWILDQHGYPRAAITYDERFGSTELWWRKLQDGSWEKREFTAKDKQFFPQGVSDDGRYLLGWTYSPNSEISIARQDTTTGQIGSLGQFDGLDPWGLIMLKQNRRVIAATCEQRGSTKLIAIDEAFAPGIARLEKQFQGYSAEILDVTPDGKTWLVWIGNSRLPGAYVLFNPETSETRPLALAHGQAIPQDQLAPAEYFTFPRHDGGGRLSGRLWRPLNRERPPLIVFCPNSLPSGVVRDLFDPQIQAFVRSGFAVLRVNLRNSWGNGAADRLQSDSNWVGGLQEDLDDAVQELVSRQIVDGSRVTLYGGGMAGVLALQVAARSKCFAAVATVNIPSEIQRSDLLSLTTDVGIAPLSGKLGGWWASGKAAAALSPVLVAPTLPIPALYLHDEESIKGRQNQAGREIRSAVKNSKALAQTDLAYSWSEFLKVPSKIAREDAEISLKIASFFDQVAPKPAR